MDLSALSSLFSNNNNSGNNGGSGTQGAGGMGILGSLFAGQNNNQAQQAQQEQNQVLQEQNQAAQNQKLQQAMATQQQQNPTSTPNLNNFAVISGLLAGALSPKDSWQSRVGAVGAQIGQSRIVADTKLNQANSDKTFLGQALTTQQNQLAAAQAKKDADHQKFLAEAMKHYPPDAVARLLQSAPTTAGYFNPINGIGYPYAPPVNSDTGGK